MRANYTQGRLKFDFRGSYFDFAKAPVRLIAVVALGWVLLSGVEAANADGTASQFIDNLGKEALAAAADKTIGNAQREKRFREILRQKFALKGIGKFVLGRYWRQASAEEQKRYLMLFENYVVYTYLRNFNNYSGQTLKIINERDEGKKGVVVRMNILNGSAPPFKLDWRLKKSRKSGQWRIVDLKIEGISMAVTQRTDFSASIRGHGGKVSPFLEDLQKKITLAKKQADAKAATK